MTTGFFINTKFSKCLKCGCNFDSSHYMPNREMVCPACSIEKHKDDNQDLLKKVNIELDRAAKKHQEEFRSSAEAFGALYLEFLEVQEEFQDHHKHENTIQELTELAAMCFKSIRFLEKRGHKW